MMFYDTVKISRPNVDSTDNCRATWWPLPQPVSTSLVGTRSVGKSFPNHQPRPDGSSGKHKAKWEGWDLKDYTCYPEEHMANGKQRVKQY